MNTNAHNIIGSNELFKGMTSEDTKQIVECFKGRFRKYNQGQLIFGQEERPNKLFAVISGRVALVKNISQGKKNILCELKAGSVFGEDFLIAGKEEYWYDAEAVVNCELLEIPLRFFTDLCDENCNCCKIMMRNLLTLITGKEKMFLKKIYINSASSLFSKISIWLVDNADLSGIVRSGMGREELANYFGVARPSLSRALMKMQEEGLIKVKKDTFYILDYERVKEFSE